jgi:Restriction endonuclease S subunits
MVNAAALTVNGHASQSIRFAEMPQEDIKWCAISLLDVLKTGKRLEATVYEVSGKHARESVENCKWGTVKLSDPVHGPIKRIYYPGRFKRIYSDAANGIPFFLPSQMTDIYPRPEKYISTFTKCDIEELRLKKGDILLTRSGTIGSVALVSKTLEDTIFSDDVIRVTPKDNINTGFLYVYFRSDTGNTILQTNGYGSVIPHIEPHHLTNMPVPSPPEIIKVKINDLIIRSFELRDESNELIDTATALFVEALRLPLIHEFAFERFDASREFNNYSVKLSNLAGRLDGTYHAPIVKAITDHLRVYAAEVTSIEDSRICKEIILPGRFKRVYVTEGQGRVFFSGKSIMELDPSDKKYLSFAQHESRIKNQLTIKQNMILLTCSGVNLGKAALVPKHWDNWAMTHDIIRIVPEASMSGYLYIWLQSLYAYRIIQSMAYGSAVPHIEKTHLKDMPVPVLKNKSAQVEINNLALEANRKRFEAYQLEQEAIRIMNDEVIFAKPK